MKNIFSPYWPSTGFDASVSAQRLSLSTKYLTTNMILFKNFILTLAVSSLLACGSSGGNNTGGEPESRQPLYSELYPPLLGDQFSGIAAKDDAFKIDSYESLRVEDSDGIEGTWIYVASAEMDYADAGAHIDGETRYFIYDRRALVSIKYIDDANTQGYRAFVVDQAGLNSFMIWFDEARDFRMELRTAREMFHGELVSDSRIEGEIVRSFYYDGDITIHRGYGAMIKISETPSSVYDLDGLKVDLIWGAAALQAEGSDQVEYSGVHSFTESRYIWQKKQDGAVTESSAVYTVFLDSLSPLSQVDDSFNFSGGSVEIRRVAMSGPSIDENTSWSLNGWNDFRGLVADSAGELITDSGTTFLTGGGQFTDYESDEERLLNFSIDLTMPQQGLQ